MSTPIENNTEELRDILQQVNELPEEGVDTPSDAVRYTEQTLTPEQQAQARANIDALAASELPEAVNDALAQAKASGEFKGDPGDPGAPGEKGDKGDTGSDGPAGANGKDGAAGKDGTSVTVKSVNESTADGGSNVVTFSDGKTLTVKNGSKGSKGDKGDTGATGPEGPQGEKGDKGDKGDTGATGSQGPAYTLTTADKNTIVNSVKAALPTLTVTGVDANGVSHSWTMYGVAQ